MPSRIRAKGAAGLELNQRGRYQLVDARDYAEVHDADGHGCGRELCSNRGEAESNKKTFGPLFYPKP
jgi:hypothetical protein